MDANMMTDGVISLDDRPAIAAIGRANKGLDDHEKKTKEVMDRTGKVYQMAGDQLVRVTDKSKNSLDRLLSSMQKQAEMVGKSGVDRLVAQRDQLISRWGKEQQAVDAINRSYGALIENERKLEETKRAAERAIGRQAAAGSVSGWMQDPFGKLKESATGFLTAIGPMGGVVLGGAAAIGTLAKASFDAMKSLGDLGVHINDVKLRTGLTTKEVGQFAFAAKAAGQDVEIFERMMRGLTEAVVDQSSEGEKGRHWLTRFGVDVRGLREGLVPTSAALEQIAQGAAGLSQFERSKAYLDLFKKAGIEAIPVMEELEAHLKTAREYGFGLSDADLQRFLKYKEDVTVIETKWDAIVRHVKEFLAAGMSQVLEDNGPKGRAARNERVLRSASPFGILPSSSYTESHPGYVGDNALQVPFYPSGDVGRNVYSSLVSSQRAADQRAANSYLANRTTADRLKDAEKELAKLPEIDQYSTRQNISDRASAEAKVRGLKAAAEAAKEFAASLKEVVRQADEADKKLITKMLNNRFQMYEQSSNSPINQELFKFNSRDIAQGFTFRSIRPRRQEQVDSEFGDWWKQQEDQQAFDSKIAGIDLQSRKDTLNRNASHAQRVVAMSGMGGTDAIQATFQIRINLAKELAVIEAERIAKEGNSQNRELETAMARKDIEKQISEAQEEAALKMLELDKQRTDLLKRESEGLWHTLLTNPRGFGKQLGSTVHEAVVKPIAEGMSAVTATVLKPVIYGSDGQGGIAGVFKGAFGASKQDPMKMATDMNTAVTAQNSAALATLTAILAGAMGMAAPAVASPAGIGGMSVPSISVSSPSIAMPSMTFGGADRNSGGGGVSLGVGNSGGFNPLSMLVASGGAGSGSAGGSVVPEDMATLSRPGRSGGGLLGMILGGGRGGSGDGSGGIGGGSPSWSGLLKNFKGIKWGGLTRSAPVYGTDADGNDSQTGGGKITGVNGIAGAALFAGGSMLAQQGLLGSSRGTWGGVGMGTLGGAAIGFQMGGPLGAAIGAVAGFGIGLGEKLAGVESPENEAKRLIKQLYGVSIDTSMAKQIVSIAQSKYAGHVSIAVRDPDVRKMLELYAQGTGQKMPLSATTPRGGSLAEQGGNLYQQATYTNGIANTFQSSLPVLGPGGGTYATPSGPNTSGGMGPNISLNINGQPITPEFVADSSMAAQNSSYGRVQQSANMQVPGLMVGT